MLLKIELDRISRACLDDPERLDRFDGDLLDGFAKR